MTTKNAIRYALIDLMEETETTGTELAEAVGVSKQAVSAWRTGKSSIDIENVPAICDFFGITIADFFNLTNEAEGDEGLSAQERELLNAFKGIDDDFKRQLLTIAKLLCNIDFHSGDDSIEVIKAVNDLESDVFHKRMKYQDD